MVGTKMSKTQKHNLSEEYLNSLSEHKKCSHGHQKNRFGIYARKG